MLGLAADFRPEHHCILDHPIIKWIKRETSDPHLRGRLFFYYHNLYKTHVIALWVNDSHTAFVDVMNLGFTPVLTHEMSNSLRKNLYAPQVGNDVARQIADANSELLHRKQNESGEVSERMMRKLSRKVVA